MEDFVSVAINLNVLPAPLLNILTPLIARLKRGDARNEKDDGEKNHREMIVHPTASQKIQTPSSPLLLFIAALLFSSGIPMQSSSDISGSGSSSETLVLHRARRVGRSRVRLPRRSSIGRANIVSSVREEEEEDEDDEDDSVEDIEKSIAEMDRSIQVPHAESFDEESLISSVMDLLGGALDPSMLEWGLQHLKDLSIVWEDSVAVSSSNSTMLLANDPVSNEGERLVLRFSLPRDSLLEFFDIFKAASGDLDVRKLLFETNGAELEKSPVSRECTGGVYRIVKKGSPVAIWKPADEEETNRKQKDTPLRRGLTPGSGALREVAAYVLDSASGSRAGVPTTTYCSLHGREGSLQQFRPSKCCADDVGTMLFENDNVHQLGILDLRIFNLDRHGGNILVDTTDYKLIPIDHGLSLPPIHFLGEAEFGWLHWRQSKEAFSKETRDWIASLSPVEDAKRLLKIGVPASSVLTNFVCTSVLQHFADLNFTLHEIGSLFCRKDSESESELEIAVRSATSALDSTDTIDLDTMAETAELVTKSMRASVCASRRSWTLGMSTASLWQRDPPLRRS